MTYKDNTPNYNVNRRVVNYKDFLDDSEVEKEKLKGVKRSFMPNSDRQQFVRNSRTEYNPVTHKLTDYTEEEVEDKLDNLKEGIFSDSEKPNKNKLSTGQESEIKICFENTVMCARSHSSEESYAYAERMANHVIKIIERGE